VVVPHSIAPGSYEEFLEFVCPLSSAKLSHDKTLRSGRQAERNHSIASSRGIWKPVNVVRKIPPA
jgi:hypothetical protein